MKTWRVSERAPCQPARKKSPRSSLIFIAHSPASQPASQPVGQWARGKPRLAVTKLATQDDIFPLNNFFLLLESNLYFFSVAATTPGGTACAHLCSWPPRQQQHATTSALPLCCCFLTRPPRALTNGLARQSASAPLGVWHQINHKFPEPKLVSSPTSGGPSKR